MSGSHTHTADSRRFLEGPSLGSTTEGPTGTHSSRAKGGGLLGFLWGCFWLVIFVWGLDLGFWCCPQALTKTLHSSLITEKESEEINAGGRKYCVWE